MPHYALFAPAYTGHLNPLFVLARALERRGHRVTVLSPPVAATRVQQAGFDFAPIATQEFGPGVWEEHAARAGALTGLSATAAAARTIAQVTRGVLRDLPALAQHHRFDGLIMDQICIGTESVCQVINLPLAVACSALAMHIESGVPPVYFPWRQRTAPQFHVRNFLGQFAGNLCGLSVLRELGPYRFKHWLRPMGYTYINELRPSLVQVAQQPAFFDFPHRHLPDHFHYTGPWIDEGVAEANSFPWDRLDGRPLIYASLGTLQNRLMSVYTTIAEACAGLAPQLVVSLGRPGAVAPEQKSAGAIFVDYAPQRALLQRATLAVTHGGLNTVLEALSAGVPLVAIPITNDQPGNAMRIEHLGVGRAVPIGKLDPASLRQAVEEVLRTPSFAQRARACAAELRPHQGAARAAELIERAFTTRQRIVAIPKP
ncbi:MAG: nucleotide disphospho-sugar-binding domain-containing protein [Opitutaceae bacterium]